MFNSLFNNFLQAYVKISNYDTLWAKAIYIKKVINIQKNIMQISLPIFKFDNKFTVEY